MDGVNDEKMYEYIRIPADSTLRLLKRLLKTRRVKATIIVDFLIPHWVSISMMDLSKIMATPYM